MTISNQDKLFAAARCGDNATIRQLAFSDVDFGARDEKGRTPFNLATQYGHADTAKTILAAKEMKYMQQLGLVGEGSVAPAYEDDAQKAVG